MVCAICGPEVGPGLGTPPCFAGAVLGGDKGFGEAVGAALAFATVTDAVGAMLDLTSGAGVAGFAVGAAVGAETGRTVGWTVGAIDGTGVGAEVGGARTATCSTVTDGTEVGTVGNSFLGFGS